METIKNVLVGQSGGPTAVINASLAGVYETARAMGAEHVYGMRYGIQGLLQEQIVDLNECLSDKMDIGAAVVFVCQIKMWMRNHINSCFTYLKNTRLALYFISAAMTRWILLRDWQRMVLR